MSQKRIPDQYAAEKPAAKPRSTFNTLAITAYGLLAVVFICLSLIRKTSPAGWLIGVPFYAVSAAFQWTAVKKGCVAGFILFILTAAVLLGVVLFTAGSV